MKARDLKSMGFKLYVSGKGRAVWVKPLVEISEDTAPEISPAQVNALEQSAVAQYVGQLGQKPTP